MSYVNIKNEFHVALDGQGLLLQGAPERLISAYEQSQAPVYGNRFASGDRDYNDLSLWWYLTQTDWAGGIKDTLSFLDDTKFYYSSNIDARTQPSTLRLEQKLTLEFDNTSNSSDVYDVKSGLVNDSEKTIYIDDSRGRDISGGAVYGSSNATFSNAFYKNYYWQFSGQVTFNDAYLYTYDGTTSSDKLGYINTAIGESGDFVYCGVEVGQTMYIFLHTTIDNLICVKTTKANPTASGDFTVVFRTPVYSSAYVVGADALGESIIFLVQNGSSSTLYKLITTTSALAKIQDFPGNSFGINRMGCRYVRTLGSKALITIMSGSEGGQGDIYSYDGSTLTKIYSTDLKKFNIGNQAVGYLLGGATIADNKAFWGNLVYDGTDFFNFIKTVDDDATYVAVPIGYSLASNKLYMADTEVVSGDAQLIIYSYDLLLATGYKLGASNSAFLIFSQHDKLQSIDKLMNSIIIGFEKLLTGQAINIYYTTNAIPTTAIADWTLLGTASYAIDGDTHYNKTFTFPSATVAKKIWFRVELVSATAGTPVLTDLTLEYLPMPPYKKEWKLNVNCGDNVKRLNGGLVQTTGRELKSRLEIAWWTKSLLDYQDMDYATNLLNGSITASSATLTVDSTLEFPEQGRVKIDDEEIFYSGKTPTTFTGLTRGARGTRAVAHSDNAVINNAYKVIITGISSRVPIALDANYLEYTVQLSIREG